MTRIEWENLLQELNQLQFLQIEGHKYTRLRYSPDLLKSGWLGKPGASEEQISQAEDRLRVTLPSSYKEFLRVSNGWGDWNTSNNVPDFNLLPIQEIDWFTVKNPDWTDFTDYNEVPDELYFVYGEEQDCVNMRDSFLKTALQISNLAETMELLLNPQVILVEGEWEAWCMDSKIAGANRYQTFFDLMQAERDLLSNLHDF
jgi:SMI1 / KNR4 family (SUKH-1)